MGLSIALLIFVVVTWGYSWVLMKIGLDYMEPFTFATWRCAVGGLCMLPFLYIRADRWPKGRKWLDYAMVGLLQTTAMFGFMLYGMKFVTAGKTAVLLYTMPVWTSLLVHFYLKQKLDGSKWLGVATGGLGILCILGWDTLVNQDLEILIGELLIIMGAISWAIANIWVKKRMLNDNTYMVSGLQMLIGTAGLALLSIPTEGLFNVELTWVSTTIILFTGVVASAINFTIWFYLIKKMDINTATFSSMLVPVFGLIFDWLQLGSKLDAGVMVGGALILVGIYKVSNHRKAYHPEARERIERIR